MKTPDIPKNIINRTPGRPIDEFWYDRNEEGDFYKVGFLMRFGLDTKNKRYLDFYYGFIRPYKYQKQGKSTGAKNDLIYKFRALHLVCTFPRAIGQWYRDDFKDNEYMSIIHYEDAININTLDSTGILNIVRDLKLKPVKGSNLNILSILDRLLK